MKRSELVDKLNSYIYTLPTFPDENSRYLANLVLDLVEEAGMLPPPVPTLASGREVGKGKPIHINEWEPENEL